MRRGDRVRLETGSESVSLVYKVFWGAGRYGERSPKDSTRLAVRGVDEGFGLVVAESRDSACGDAGEFGGGDFTFPGESLIVRVSQEDY